MKTEIEDFNGRKIGLTITLLFLSALSLYVLSEVFWTLFVAAALSYILYPGKEKLVSRGFSDRQSGMIITLALFASLALFILPLALILFDRLHLLIEFLTSLPDQFVLDFLEFEYVIQTSELQSMTANWLSDTAVGLAGSIPSLSLKLILFVFVFYAAISYSRSVEQKVVELFPDSSKDIIYSYNDRIEKTLVGIFAVQALTALMTFVIALPVFFLLGYEPFISLAVIAALLQFIPIAGPAFLIIILAALELTAGSVVKALAILFLGLVVIGLLPDAYLRPRLANMTTGLPASLYFAGFTGGALTIGAVGVVAGPLLIALMLETVELLLENT